ncbi:MAG: S-layer homology domain-containing protein [Negativicutes bacterium]|nr:S-layer homology domain-containing protein [Negativicutes bacterium]
MKKTAFTLLLVLAMLLTSFPMLALAEEPAESPLIMPVMAKSYPDLPGSWYEAEATRFGYPEIFADADGLFHGDQAITRMEFARTLHKALGIEINYLAATDIAEYFNDVQNDDPGAGALYDLVTAGIVEKTDSFRPNQTLQRQEMIHLIINALNYITEGKYAVILMMPAPFNDDSKIKEEYRSNVITAVLLKLIYGRGENMLYPTAPALRAEGVAVISRLVTLLDSYKPHLQAVAAMQVEDNSLRMSLSLHNNTDQTITIEHSSSQKYDFQLLDAAGAVLYTWSADRSFLQVLCSTKIAANETIEFSEELPAETYNKLKAKITGIRAFLTGSCVDATIDPNGYLG